MSVFQISVLSDIFVLQHCWLASNENASLVIVCLRIHGFFFYNFSKYIYILFHHTYVRLHQEAA